MKNVLNHIITICFFGILFSSQGQKIVRIEETFTEDASIRPFTATQLYGCELAGSITLNSDTSFVRIFLRDQSDHHFIVFESYPLISGHQISFSDTTYETHYINTIPDEIYISINDASFYLNHFLIDTVYDADYAVKQSEYKYLVDSLKVLNINYYLEINKIPWRAAQSDFTNFPYEDKKRILENTLKSGYMQGIEYYSGGFFPIGGNYISEKSEIIVDEFDWRNRHRANNPISPYYDNDPTGSGWITPRYTGQACSDCWAFGGVYTMQSNINLFFNQHLNKDLSEQQIIRFFDQNCCDNNGGWAGSPMNFIVNYGIVPENCCPYTPQSSNCDVCTNPEDVFKAENKFSIYGTGNSNLIKENLIKYGLCSTEVIYWGHAMAMVGYGKVKVGDLIMDGDHSHTGIEILVEEGSQFIGCDYWIFEQSWGDWGANGTPFIYVIANPASFNSIYYFTGEITSNIYDVDSIQCLDEDNDGYFNWGIADIKPPTCPTCPDERDCDDSNPWLGPFDDEYNCELLCENFTYQSSPFYINSVVTIQDKQYFDCDVIVTPGNELIIEGEIGFVENAKLIVQRNAKLTIDGGKVTGTCGNLWRGVEVRGNINQPQNPQYQGWVEIINGGTIENALYGIRTIHAEDDEYTDGEIIDPTYSGGIIFANNARFVNNKTAIQFYSYPNESMSNFYECEFETNAEIISGVTPNYFMWIDHISGVNITDCSFNNTTGTDYLHSGIYSRDATFSIEGRCTTPVAPCNQWEYGWFRKLNYAVYVVNTNTIYYPDIRHTDFSLCKRSIYISTTDGARVTTCRFYMPAALSFSTGDYGLYLNNSYSYHIEDNQFMGPSSSQLGGIGLYINFSEEHWNQVYNNSFSYLNYGTMAYGLNRKPDGVGLCIKCNDYDNNKYDIVVNGRPGSGHGIAYDQGHMGVNDTLPAGNTFTQNFPQLVYNYMNSNGMAFINYVYHEINPTQEEVNPNPYYSPLTMSKQPNLLTEYIKSSACPSKLDAGGGGHDRDGIETADTQISQKKAQIEALVDGGNTFSMNLDVVTSTPPESSEVYNELMSESPFLSDTVMKSAIYKENVLPSAMVRDVLVANPQSAKNTEIMEAIDERFDPMPEWMKEQVLQGVNTTGAKEVLESELAKWESKRAEHFNNLYQHFRKDTINPQASSDSLEILLAVDNRLESKYRMAFINIQQGAWNEGLAVLNSIPAEFGLTPFEESVHQDYISLFNTLEQLNGDLPAEGSAQALQLELLAANDETFPGACARNLLFAAGLIEYEEPIILPEEGLKSSEAIGDRSDRSTGKLEVLKVFPNPAGDYFIAEYNADGYTGAVSLFVTDVTGKMVYTSQYYYNRDQVVINTEDWSSGVYQISLMINGKIIKNEKVTVK